MTTATIGINGKVVSEDDLTRIADRIAHAADKAEWNEATKDLARLLGTGCVLNSAPAPTDGYVDGAILSCSWGWEQTNVDFYRIVKRAGPWVKLQKLTKTFVETGDMCGKVVPMADDAEDEPIRRKLAFDGQNQPSGCKFMDSYGWISLWDGKPERVSWYG